MHILDMTEQLIHQMQLRRQTGQYITGKVDSAEKFQLHKATYYKKIFVRNEQNERKIGHFSSVVLPSQVDNNSYVKCE